MRITRSRVSFVASLVASIGIMALIFSFSAQNGGESGSLSESVARAIAPILHPDFPALSDSRQRELLDALAWPIRKTAHATEYGVLAMALFSTFWHGNALRRSETAFGASSSHGVSRISGLAFATSVLYACTDELHQLFIDGRAGQVADVLVDASGALIGVLLCALIARLVMRRSSL